VQKALKRGRGRRKRPLAPYTVLTHHDEHRFKPCPVSLTENHRHATSAVLPRIFERVVSNRSEPLEFLQVHLVQSYSGYGQVGVDLWFRTLDISDYGETI